MPHAERPFRAGFPIGHAVGECAEFRRGDGDNIAVVIRKTLPLRPEILHPREQGAQRQICTVMVMRAPRAVYPHRQWPRR